MDLRGSTPPWWPVRVRREDEERTSSGIYGIIVGAGVLASSHAERAAAVIGAVAVTLLVYWAAERYARLVADRIHAGHKPGWREVGRQLGRGWEMVTASALPVLVLAVLTARGTDLESAIFAALGCSTLLLCVAGWEIGRGADLSVLERLALVVVAGAFGGLMIASKALLH